MTSNLRDLIDASMAEHPQHARMADIELDELTKQIAALRSENEQCWQENEVINERCEALRSENEALRKEVTDQFKVASGCIEVNAGLRSQLAQAREALEKIRGLSFNFNLVAAYDIATEALRSPATPAASDASEPVPQGFGVIVEQVVGAKDGGIAQHALERFQRAYPELSQPVPQDEAQQQKGKV